MDEQDCHSAEFTAKYVDDSVKAVAVNLTQCLEKVNHQVRPVTFHQRTGHQLSSSHNSLQRHLYVFKEFIDTNEFEVNISKSFIMLFRNSQKYDFQPEFRIEPNGEMLNVVSEAKILGLYLTYSLSVDKHVEYICSKAATRIWALRRMMELGLDHEIILECYFKEIRSVLEYGSVVFHGSLTKKLKNKIESVQKRIFNMLGKFLGLDMSYSELCTLFCAEPLHSRRFEISKTFIKRNLKNPRFSYLFEPTRKTHNTRPTVHRFQETRARTSHFYNSPLLYLRRLSNRLDHISE